MGPELLHAAIYSAEDYVLNSVPAVAKASLKL